MALRRTIQLAIPFTLMGVVLLLSGCTTYTWPDGSQKTVLGVVAEDDNKRFEEQQAEGVRYREPGVIPQNTPAQ
ncbi:hypothetical protein [Halomonas dongshanensis]|uniref:Uncharacterized protein n=1 Tax=Halomonas dongshanensis TaxID=2890835 RepID=A0ABT2EG36_9GAMM|nr:hypothetical protein [Halomonas dongshanensis]MCS2610515.1 hypothetical protein [Halomonas dongshanensis]